MVIGVVIPDRNDRPEFLKECLRMIGGQTLSPDFVQLVNYKPLSEDFDLTPRVKLGIETLKRKGCDVVLIMENDDFYSKEYIETMIREYKKAGEPDIFGTGYTYYYHLQKKAFRKLEHKGRASLMNTLIRTNIEINYPNDSEVYLDLVLWKNIKGETFDPLFPLSIGIKHGVGLCGGNGHSEMKYNEMDPDFKFLGSVVDQKRFNFYTSLKW